MDTNDLLQDLGEGELIRAGKKAIFRTVVGGGMG